MSKGKQLSLKLLMLVAVVQGYVICGMYWLGKIGWAPVNLFFYPTPGPWGVCNFLVQLWVGMTWFIPGLVIALVIGEVLDPTAWARARALWRGEEKPAE